MRGCFQMKPKRRTPKGNVAHHGKTAAIVRATRTASPNAPGKALWPKAFAPKPTLEEQNRRAAEFRQQKRQAAENAEGFQVHPRVLARKRDQSPTLRCKQ